LWITEYLTILRVEISASQDGRSVNAIIYNVDALNAGIYCYLGQLMMYACHNGWEATITRETKLHAFNFSMLYLYLDYFIDDSSRSEDDKRSFIATIHSILQGDGSECERRARASALYIDMIDSYDKIVAGRPDVKSRLLDVFNSEVLGYMVQHNSLLNRSQYMSTALDKGGSTCLAIAQMLGLEIGGSYRLGSCIQLIDDMFDVYDDMDNDIHTVATSELSTYGDMDRLWCFTVHKVDKVCDTYAAFKPLLIAMLQYIVITTPSFSPTLKEIIRRNDVDLSIIARTVSTVTSRFELYCDDIKSGRTPCKDGLQ
jgi:hypothetical protein